MAAEQLTIGDLPKATETKVETIRYYERIGLLPAPARTRGNYRSYSSKQLGRLSFIRRARDLGFSLRQVRELLSLSDQRRRSCEAVDAVPREHLAEVDRKLADYSARSHRKGRVHPYARGLLQRLHYDISGLEVEDSSCFRLTEVDAPL